MIEQYPHTLTATISGSSVQDANGNWQTTGPTTVVTTCRAEPNTGGGKIKSADGTVIDYAWTVFMPLPMEKIPHGTVIEVVHGAEVLLKDAVKRFSRGQLNARIWL
jgi:hypothetical protein